MSAALATSNTRTGCRVLLELGDTHDAVRARAARLVAVRGGHRARATAAVGQPGGAVAVSDPAAHARAEEARATATAESGSRDAARVEGHAARATVDLEVTGPGRRQAAEAAERRGRGGVRGHPRAASAAVGHADRADARVSARVAGEHARDGSATRADRHDVAGRRPEEIFSGVRAATTAGAHRDAAARAVHPATGATSADALDEDRERARADVVGLARGDPNDIRRCARRRHPRWHAADQREDLAVGAAAVRERAQL